jgi:SAM-dependent methyltransferase
MEEMKRLLGEHLDPNAKLSILDVGSMDYGAAGYTYRTLMAPAWTYVGCDVKPGPNVDMVQVSEDTIQGPGAAYDVVISGQCLEHVKRPWRLVPEMARMLRPGGLLIVTAPWQWKVHRYPLDCWRILPDGMRVLLEDGGLTCAAAYIKASDCWGVGAKPRAAPAEPKRKEAEP